MSRGGSFGGGQSSLGYLFGGDEKKKNPSPPKSMPSNPTMTPPYGIDIPKQKSAENECPPPSSMTSEFIFSHNDSIDRAEGQNSGIFHNNARPSTKVKSAPGGHSSLGYLFEEDKSS